jgi:ABC-type transport system involved in multi-copper enzyme maturation permease subunit
MRIPGPVFQKEVWILGKKTSTAWIRFAYGVVLVFIVTIVFFSQGFGNQPHGAAALQRYQDVAPTLTISVVWVQFVLLTLIGIALGGPAICDEKRMGTLGTLLTTPLQAWQIVLGKLLGRAVELVVIALLATPLLLATRTFGGVSGAGIAMFAGTCMLSAIVATQIAILASILSKRATGAIVLAMLMTGLVYFAPVLIRLAILLTKAIQTGGGGPGNPGIIVVTCPPVVMGLLTAELMSGESISRSLGISMTKAWLLHAAYMLVVLLVCFVIASLALRRSLVREATGAPARAGNTQPRASSSAIQPADASTAQDEAPLDTPADPSLPKVQRRRRRVTAALGTSRTVGDHPVLWREVQQRIARSPWVMWTVAVVAMVLITGVTYLAEFHEAAHIALAITLAAASLLSACVASTGTIASERESRTLEALLCTPLPARRIVWAKLVGSLRRVGVVLILLFCQLILLGVCADPVGIVLQTLDPLFRLRRGPWHADPVHLVALPHILLIVGSCVFLLLASGVYFSTRLKKSATATVCNFSFALVLWAIIPIAGGITSGAFERMAGIDDGVMGDIVLSPNPVFMTFQSVQGAIEHANDLGSIWKVVSLHPDAQNSDWTYDFPEGRLGILGFSFMTLIFAGVYTTGGVLFMNAAARRLREVPQIDR